jgi:hypothetical protein
MREANGKKKFAMMQDPFMKFQCIYPVMITAMSLIVLGLLETSCGKSGVTEAPLPTVRGSSSNSDSENRIAEQLKKYLTPGVSKQEVDAVFGMPTSEDQLSSNRVFTIYLFSSAYSPQPNGTITSGFSAIFEDGRLVIGKPITSEITTRSNIPIRRPMSPTRLNDQGSVGDESSALQEIQCYVESAYYATNSDANSYDANAKRPGYAISQLSAVSLLEEPGNADRSSGQRFSIGIRLSGSDVEGFKRFTSQNVGKRIIMICDQKRLADVVIKSPVDSGSFEIQFTNKAECVAAVMRLKLLFHTR